MKAKTPTTSQTAGSKRPLLALLTLSLLALALGFSFYAGTRYSPQGPSPQEQAQAHIDVWGSIETRPVNDALALSGQAQEGSSLPISITPPGAPTLVHASKKPGDSLEAGDLIGIVGGEGIYALEGPLPLYRELGEGDSGHDVQELQKALTKIGYPTNTDGTVSTQTLKAVEALLKSDLQGVEEVTSIKPGNFALVPAGSHQVLAAASVGQDISPDNPIVTLEASSPYAQARASLAQIETLEKTSALTVTSSQGSSPAQVQSIGQLQQDAQGAFKMVNFTLENPAILVPGQTVSLSGPGNTEPVLAVPTSAVRQQGARTYLILEDAQGQKQEVEVQVLRTAGGWAAISGQVSDGQKVLLS